MQNKDTHSALLALKQEQVFFFSLHPTSAASSLIRVAESIKHLDDTTWSQVRVKH